MNERTELDASGEKLEQDLLAIFDGLRLVPDVVIECIDHAGFAEDGQTFILTCTTSDGDTLFVSVCPGEPVLVRRTHKQN